eukprot:maker-scaffold_19-snap-gene-0.24-mRNA-1 protein AED:0.00 eAED:0.00 QI:134/1/1/1/1/1/2/254/512
MSPKSKKIETFTFIISFILIILWDVTSNSNISSFTSLTEDSILFTDLEQNKNTEISIMKTYNVQKFTPESPSPLLFFPENLINSTNHKNREKKFSQSLIEKCQFWSEKILLWKKKILSKDSKETDIIYAYLERSGIGDRLAGIQGALFQALLESKQLHLDWRHLDRIFKSSTFVSNAKYNYTKKYKHQEFDTLRGEILPRENENFVFKVNGAKYWKGRRSLACEKGAAFKCRIGLREKEKCEVYTRSCLGPTYCRGLTDLYSKSELSSVHTVGCPLRLLMSFTDSFFNVDVDFTLHGEKRKESLMEFVKEISEYKLISVHIRSGDASFRLKGEWKTNIVSSENVLNISGTLPENFMDSNIAISENSANLADAAFICGSDIFSDENTRFIILSDNMVLKNYLMKKFGYKAIVVNSPSLHITDSFGDKNEKIRQLENTFIEWFLVYYADELITNLAHSFGISAFSRSARMFSLRSDYYEIDENVFPQKCKKEEFRYEGNIGQVSSICKKNLKQP